MRTTTRPRPSPSPGRRGRRSLSNEAEFALIDPTFAASVLSLSDLKSIACATSESLDEAVYHSSLAKEELGKGSSCINSLLPADSLGASDWQSLAERLAKAKSIIDFLSGIQHDPDVLAPAMRLAFRDSLAYELEHINDEINMQESRLIGICQESSRAYEASARGTVSLSFA